MPSPISTLADLRLVVRRNVSDPLKVKIDTIPSYDGSSNPLDLGKDMPIEPLSELLTVNGVAQARGTVYSLDYDARQLTFTTAGLPGAGTALRLRYSEARYQTSQIDLGLNQGRKILFPTLYKKGLATITLRNLVREYDLAGTDVNEQAMRNVFREGHLNFKILRARMLPLGNSDQAWFTFRRFDQQGDTILHLYELMPAGYTMRLEVAYAFTPLINPQDQCDVPDLAVDILTEWASGVVADKQEVIRARVDTAAGLQNNFATAPGTLKKTYDDFMVRVQAMRRMLNVEPLVIEPRDIPLRFEAGLLR